MDLSETIIPNSDQLNADDLISGPRTVTVVEVSKGNAEQPVDIHLAEFPGRAYRPSKSMRRVLVAAWGNQSSAYIGKRLTLYRDPEVMFGRDKVGGIKISHMDGIDKPLRVALTVTRGKRSPHIVDPITEPAPVARDWAAEIEAATTVDELRGLWKSVPTELHARITERVAELQEPQP